MRKIAFGYSTRCNIRCEHCVAADDIPDNKKMELGQAEQLVSELADADVRGISFTAGEPFLHFDDMKQLVTRCSSHGMYTRMVTNCFWAKTGERSDSLVSPLRDSGLRQLRMSYSRWHQKHINRRNIVNAAASCNKVGLDYFVSFVTDFSEADEPYEAFLRENHLKFFPEPLLYAGRAASFERKDLCTDYQDNCCPMNPYLSPDLDMYACCDAGNYFTNTNFFYLGNIKNDTIDNLFQKSETNILYNHIRTLGITTIASFMGFPSREIIKHRKCDLCKKIFDSPETLEMLRNVADTELQHWRR